MKETNITKKRRTEIIKEDFRYYSNSLIKDAIVYRHKEVKEIFCVVSKRFHKKNIINKIAFLNCIYGTVIEAYRFAILINYQTEEDLMNLIINIDTENLG